MKKAANGRLFRIDTLKAGPLLLVQIAEEEQDQNDRQRNTDQPKKTTAKHVNPPMSIILTTIMATASSRFLDLG
jgi:hypothetical protein